MNSRNFTHYLQETTDDWTCDYNVPKHTYIMYHSKCVGYIKEGTTEEIFFSKSLKQFDQRRRKFKKIKKGELCLK